MRRRNGVPERDEKGRRLETRISTVIWGDNYNWVQRRTSLQFGAILNRAIEAMKAQEAEEQARLTPQGQLKLWVAERNKRGVSTTPEELAAQRRILGIPELPEPPTV